MKRLKSAFAVICLSAAYASAHAQVYGAESSVNTYGYYSSAGIYVTGASGDYYNLVPTDATGSGDNFSFAYGGYGTNDQTFGYYSLAVNESFAGPGIGYAQSGYGFEEFLTFTNETGSTGYFSVYSFLSQVQETTNGGTAIDYGGIQEFGGEYYLGYNTVTLDDLGLANDDAVNWNLNGQNTYAGFSYEISGGGFKDYLLPGQSIMVGVWASGITTATSTGSSVPAPAAIAPFAVGLLGALQRRNKKH